MIRFLEPMLYIDDQAQVPVCLCEKCGGECYAPDGVCRCCEGDAEAAGPLRRRLRELRLLLAATEDPEEIWRCKRRIAELTPMLTQMNELAELTAHYYDRGYYRNEKYTV